MILLGLVPGPLVVNGYSTYQFRGGEILFVAHLLPSSLLAAETWMNSLPFPSQEQLRGLAKN